MCVTPRQDLVFQEVVLQDLSGVPHYRLDVVTAQRVRKTGHSASTINNNGSLLLVAQPRLDLLKRQPNTPSSVEPMALRAAGTKDQRTSNELIIGIIGKRDLT